MRILVCYDIALEGSADQARLRRVAKTCEGFGHRIQQSVFECELSPVSYQQLLFELGGIIDHGRDRVDLFRLREPADAYSDHLGTVADVGTGGTLAF